MPLERGLLLSDRYRIERLHKLASESAIYLASDMHNGSPVAVKENLIADSLAAQHFAVEADLLATLRHPNIPRAMDYFESDAGQFLVMDFIDGEDLSEWITHSNPNLADLIRILGGVFDALAYIHSQRPPVIHRDIEPSNIILGTRGTTFLVDFGQAKRYRAPNVPGMSDAVTDSRSDQYSLAATIYTLLTGAPPPASLDRVRFNVAVPSIAASRADVSPAAEQAIMKALSVRASDRHKDISAFRRALRV